ncbi:MAG: STAS domain-containing protein [Flavobacteriales bacterium]|nr:STAS domain-containing protein [Flavobacteriales bacterium]MCB9448943.1 STAS domain-containing protein [Flavobacteriales bacterium]
MDFAVEVKDKYAVIRVNAEKLNSAVAPGLKSQLVVSNSEGVKNLIMEMSCTRYCDSSGLSAILVANRLCKNAGGCLVLAGLQDPVMKLINISQLDGVLNIVPTVDEAVDFIFMEEVEKDVNDTDE